MNPNKIFAFACDCEDYIHKNKHSLKVTMHPLYQREKSLINPTSNMKTHRKLLVHTLVLDSKQNQRH